MSGLEPYLVAAGTAAASQGGSHLMNQALGGQSQPQIMPGPGGQMGGQVGAGGGPMQQAAMQQQMQQQIISQILQRLMEQSQMGQQQPGAVQPPQMPGPGGSP